MTHTGLPLILFVALIASGCDRPTAAPPAPPPPPPASFYGRVIDQSGTPLAGAEIVVQLSELKQNPIVPGGVARDRLPQNRFSVYSGSTGSFVVLLTPPNHVIDIESMKKEGYDWVFDWAWTLSSPPHTDGDNRSFTLPGNLWKVGYYKPDPDRPAIFPMHRRDDPQPAALPSRGGSDSTRDGRIVVNDPLPLKVPSAGPGAPTPQQAGDRIGEYLDRYNAAQRAKSR